MNGPTKWLNSRLEKSTLGSNFEPYPIAIVSSFNGHDWTEPPAIMKMTTLNHSPEK